MRILLLSDCNSVHTKKWVSGLCHKGLEVGLWSLTDPDDNFYEAIKVPILNAKNKNQLLSNKEGSFLKVKYLFKLFELRNAIKKFKPNILHSHYASSYGLLGSLTNFHPFIVSVWGDDIFSFPEKNILFSSIIKFVFKKADQILSTSHVMALEVSKYSKKIVLVTPFGVDINLFEKQINISNPFKTNVDTIVIGTIKTLEVKYGIEILIRAFNKLIKKNPSLDVRLVIVGGGSLLVQLKNVCKQLGIESKVSFSGKIKFNEIPIFHSYMDIEVFPSISDGESFGVSVVEAMASSNPVIVSNVGGLPEVVADNHSGFVVPKEDFNAICEKIEYLINNKDFAFSMGQNGRKRVAKLYNWEKNCQLMIQIYNEVLNS